MSPLYYAVGIIIYNYSYGNKIKSGAGDRVNT